MNNIFDTFLYYDEIDILKIRLRYLHPYICKFIICECDYDFNGNYKGFNFNINNFKEFETQIIYYKYKLNKNKINNDWFIHDSSRDYLFQKTKKIAKKDSLIIHGDIDEIPNDKYLSFFKKSNINNFSIFCFKQKGYFFKFNLYDDKEFWIKSKITKLKNIKSFSQLRKLKGKNYHFLRLDTFLHPDKSIKIRVLQNGGWHFTYMRSTEDIIKKFSSVIEFKYKKKLTKSTINDLLGKKINIINLLHGSATYLKKININQEFPKNLCDILFDYKYLILE